MNRATRQLLTSSLLAIAGFFVIIAGSDQLLFHQQTTHLKAVYQTYLATGKKTQAVAEAEDVAITPLVGKPESKRQKLMQDLIDQKRTIVDHTPQVVTFNGQTEQLFIFEGQHNHFVGVWQKKASLANTSPSDLWVFTIGYWALMIVLIGWQVKRQRYWQGHIDTMTQNIAHIRQEGSVNPIILTPGSPFMAMGAEINHLEQAVDHLRTKVVLRQASFDRLIDHLPQGVMLIDADRNVLLANQAMARFVGHPIAPNVHNYLDDVKTYRLARMIEHTFRNQKSHHKEMTMLTTQMSVDANVIALKAQADREQVLVILYDVTYLRQVEQMQLDFVGNVSHELKTPVTAISGFAETLLAGAKDDPATLDQFLNIIHDESTRLTSLITDILTLSRPSDAPAKHSAVDLNQLMDQAVKSLAKPIKEKQLDVSIHIPDDLTIQSDDVKLSQVIRNLLNNAVFYNRDHGSVDVTATTQPNQLTLTFQDTGIGIADTDQQRIFERFYRVDKARSRHNGGTGLGLAIVAEMLQQLGGDVAIHSQVGVGTTFTVTLPR
ncbi:two-component system histidine kinase PnpS [Lacticaseibacillus porcinae]|uniref:two-component system histidine kinase PnpS n=1 Tax=Lacticaseibacillus porcinae TaxID=1123687 RepID=UPI000F777F79|nr:ATP-binding protein [Lacticaseibacillus porcinae]